MSRQVKATSLRSSSSRRDIIIEKIIGNNKLLLMVIITQFLLICVLLVTRNNGRAVYFNSKSMTDYEKPFSLFVTLQFKEEQYKEQFINDITPLCDYIKEHEPDTISYEILLSDKDPLQVLIMERYKNKDNAFLNIHRNSKQFLEFRPKLKDMIDNGYVTMNGESYIDSGIGFGDRVIV